MGLEVSLLARPRLRMTARYRGLVVLLLPLAAGAQGNLDPRQDARLQAIAGDILDEQTQNGPYSVDLLEPLTALELFYEESGSPGLAIATLERAQQVVRANYGLRSLEQTPLIRRRIRNEEQRGNVAAAWDLEQSLLTLIRGHPTDLRTVPILREVATRRIDVLERYLAGGFAPEVVLGCYYGRSYWGSEVGSCTSGSRTIAARSILADSQMQYERAIDVLLRNGLHASDEVRELEAEIVHNSYRHADYRWGRRSLGRLVAYSAMNSEPARNALEAAVEVGDWDMLFGQYPNALTIYEQTYERLIEDSTATAAVEQLFAPDLPIMLPAFLPNPLANDSPTEPAGYIEVAFEVTKYGRGRRIDVLGASGNVTRAATKALIHLIAASRFRPRVVRGEFADTRAVVRYPLREQVPAPWSAALHAR